MKRGKENLKQRAYLNTVTSFIDYGTKALVSFTINPFIVNGLGGTLFGVWQMLGQITNYSNLADLKASTVLKWAVARDREKASEEELRNYVTTTFALVLLMLPLILVVASVVAWYLPDITGVQEKYIPTIRLAFLVLIISFVVNKFFNVFESILNGMNLGFKRMGIRAAVTIVGGGLSVLVINMGYGLVGLALVNFTISIILGIILTVVVKRSVYWFGLGKFSFGQSKTFFKTSGWFMAWSGLQMVLTNSDKVLLGFLASPFIVTQYVITKYLLNTIKDILMHIINGVLPGMGKLYKKGEFDKMIVVRKQLRLITWIFVIGVGFVGLLFNRSFVSLWIGDEQYAGQFVNLLLILMTIQFIFIINEGTLINITLNIKKKVYLGVISVIISVFFVFLTVEKYGIVGLAISMMLGRSIVSVAYPIIVSKMLQAKFLFDFSSLRLFLLLSFLFSLGYFLGEGLLIRSWFLLGLGGVAIFVVTLLLAFYVGLTTSDRKMLATQLKQIRLLNKE